MEPQKVVCIMGAGVGGLAAAHELVKRKDCIIHVIERNSAVGGQSRSEVQDGSHTEYCWHAVASGYRNLPKLLSEIPFETHSVLENLQPIEKYNVLSSNGEHSDINRNFLTNFDLFFSSFQKITGERPLWDYIKMIAMYFRIKAMCEERLVAYDDVKWKDYIESKFSNKHIRRWFIDSTSIYLGMEYDEINAHLMMDLFRHNSLSGELNPDYDFYSFNGPINEKWFDPWKAHLEKQGVIFHMNTEIVNVTTSQQTILNVHMKDKIQSSRKILKATTFVNGLGIESLSYLFPERTDFSQLARIGHQIQTQILFSLDYRIPEEMNTVYIFPDSPWFLMSRHEGSLWNLEDRDLLSTGIGIWNQRGLNGKTALECSPTELAEECWAQMCLFQPLFPSELPKWDIWDNFKFVDDLDQLTTWEPKFSNNIGSLKLRPHTQDSEYTNLLHATAYTRSSMNIFNMDAAAEAGIAAGGGQPNICYKPTMFYRVLQWFDRIIFKIQQKLCR